MGRSSQCVLTLSEKPAPGERREGWQLVGVAHEKIRGKGDKPSCRAEIKRVDSQARSNTGWNSPPIRLPNCLVRLAAQWKACSLLVVLADQEQAGACVFFGNVIEKAFVSVQRHFSAFCPCF